MSEDDIPPKDPCEVCGALVHFRWHAVSPENTRILVCQRCAVALNGSVINKEPDPQGRLFQ